MSKNSIQFQDQVHVATLKRQDSDLILDKSFQSRPTTPHRSVAQLDSGGSSRNSIEHLTVLPAVKIENVVPQPARPRLDIRLSNADVTDIYAVNQVTHRDTPTPILPEQRREKPPMTSRFPKRNIWRIASVYVCGVMSGFSDATPGAILPYVETHYGLNYTTVSLIWIANAAGFILIAALSHKIQEVVGRERSLIAANVFNAIMYTVVLTGTAFPAIVAAFFVGGLGLAIVSAQANVFLARLDKLSKYLAFYHGSYGVGATISPLISTAFVSAGIRWNLFYLVLLAMSLVCIGIVYYAWKGADKELKPWDDDLSEAAHLLDLPTEEDGIGLADLNQDGISTRNKNDSTVLQEALKFPNTWLVAFFILFYQGSEVALGGWIVTFLLDYRHGPASVGYVASGFWLGLTVGRMCLTRPLHKYIGIRRSVIIFSLLAILMVTLTWIIPNVYAAGVLVSLAGVAIGVNIPLTMTLTVDLFPRKIQVVSLTIVTAFGSSGGAMFPFLTGILSQRLGPYIVLPVFIVLYSLMLVLWICLPNRERVLQGKEVLTLWQKFW